MINFEVVSKYRNTGIVLPVRKTSQSAGYDFQVAEDIVIPAWLDQNNSIAVIAEKAGFIQRTEGGFAEPSPISLDQLAAITKIVNARPTLVPTGVKCRLDPGTYLELSVRSSSPLKYWLILANGVGIIDADYYNNPDNEGHIFFQIINFSPLPIQLKKGDVIGQGIIKQYLTTESDTATGTRQGGFGSTGNSNEVITINQQNIDLAKASLQRVFGSSRHSNGSFDLEAMARQALEREKEKEDEAASIGSSESDDGVCDIPESDSN